MKLVTSYEQALASATRFQRVDKVPDSIAFSNLGSYFHWHYFEEIHGFAPSKFIGYVGTTVAKYASEGTGTHTVRALDRIFVKVPRPSQLFDMLAEHLAEWLGTNGKRLSMKTITGTGGIYVRRDSALSDQLPQTTESIIKYFEGNPVEVRQTRYEREPKARKACLDRYGYSCKACAIDFEQRYGEIGREYIHVHHIEPLSSTGTRRKIDPIVDLIPLCPNCHAMIHKLPDRQTLDELRSRIR